MARVIDKLPDRREVSAKYPWSDWTDGQVWLALQGEDYTVKEDAFRSVLRQHAESRRLSVATRQVRENGEVIGVAFQFSRNGAAA